MTTGNRFPHRNRAPEVFQDAFVAPTATLVGAVQIGPNSSVWHGAVLRGDAEPIIVGARTSIQDNCVVHSTSGWQPTVVGDDVTVGHGALIHGCMIHDRVLVGMGSLILDEAEIGADVILGAGSLVTARKKIPPGTMVFGRPAKVIRDLTEEELISIRVSAQRYVERGREYLDDLEVTRPTWKSASQF